MKKIFFCCIIVLSSICVNAQTVFKVDNPDKKLSPYTGMTRQHWKDAALYLLKGAFSYVHNLDDPMLFPKQPGKSYPIAGEKIPTAKLEGLSRTMFIAGPLLKENPSLQIGDIKVAAYYRHQLELMLDKNSPSFIKNRGEKEGPGQNLVEFGAITLSLMTAPEIFWDPLTQDTKNALAEKMLSYGEGPTIEMNWRFFNIHVMSFFKSRGYKVNEDYLVQLLEKSLKDYSGDGWYKDGTYYDYYSMWGYQMYGAFWAEYYGKKYYPAYAKRFIDNLHDLATHYPLLFGRDGKMIMWGRSNSYRMGVAIPFPLLAYTNDASINYGWMRRIASSTMLQFLENPDFLSENVPTLGFYGPFEPTVQSYSCRGSVYWMGKIFFGLYTPADSPFWTAVENEGDWNTKIQKAVVYNELQKNTDILITDYANIGASELRTSTSSKVINGYHGSECYNRLSYNSVFPWQADGPNGEVAMNYVTRNSLSKWEALRMSSFQKFEDGIYYRKAVVASHPNTQFNLADIPMTNGILRVDKIASDTITSLRLGHYALPELKEKIKKSSRKINGYEVQIIDNGAYQLALVSLKGWKKMETIDSQDLHPESKYSSVINVSDEFVPQTNKNVIYATLMLWKKSGAKWTNDELVPVKKIQESNEEVTVTFKNGKTSVVRFN